MVVSLIHKKKTILENVVVAKSIHKLALGLMFASKRRLKKGICLYFPEDLRHGASITMWFCFFKYEILFVNSQFKVVDKVVLRPFKTTYIPKEKCKYVFESTVGTFKGIEIGNSVILKFT